MTYTDTLKLIAEPLCGRRPPRGAPWVRKFGNLSMREILVMTSAYACPSTQTTGEGEGSPKTARRGVEDAIFSWREIARSFWADGVFLGGKSHGDRRF